MNNKLLIVLAAIVLVVVLFFAFSRQSAAPETTDIELSQLPEEEQIPFEPEMPRTLSINLNEQNDSGETGFATLTEENGQVTVTLSLQGYPEDTPQPAHIHIGSCPDVGAVQYPLINVLNGESTTLLEVTLAQLESEMPLGINVHKSVPETNVYTACGDLEF